MNLINKMQQHKQINNYSQVAPLIQKNAESNPYRYNSYYFYDQFHIERQMKGKLLD